MTISLAQRKALLKRYASKNEIDKAVTLLCKMAVASAKKGKFDIAEAYRDLLYEMDSNALVAIMKVNEFIETEKKHAKNIGLQHAWPEFFNKLSRDEANAFFHALQPMELEDDYTMLGQGKPNDRLYLVEQGKLKVVFESDNREVLIHQLGRGNVFGEDTFFSVNVCTASVVTLSSVQLKYLDQVHLKRIEQTFPVISDSLQRICAAGKQTYDYLKEKRLDRRAAKRIHLESKIAVQLLTAESSHPMQCTFHADLWDVSKYGLCFHLQSKNREFVRRMIGRSLGIRLKLEINGRFKTAAVTGIVHGVQNHDHQHYSVHVKLNPPFSDMALNTIERIAALRRKI
jgi:CRP-like cAMP-binding protein